MHQWPDHLPANCPPSDSDYASGVVYRLIRNSTLSPDDFKSQREMFPDKNLGQPECIACGLSVLKDYNDIAVLKDRIPAKKNWKCAKGTLKPEMGRIKYTFFNHEASHSTWWMSAGTRPWEFFEVIKE